MAVKGNIAKSIITNKILETFPNSFCYDKEIRIPIQEGSELLQIKCTLVTAKVNVENGSDTAVPVSTPVSTSTVTNTSLTEDEKREVVDLLASLNL